MTGYLYLATFLAGVTVGIGLVAWILHRTDKQLEAAERDQVKP